MENRIVSILLEKGQHMLQKPKEAVEFTKNPDADLLLNDIENYPHIFVLGCVMDRQIKAERAWLIPYYIAQEINSNKFSDFLLLSKKQLIDMFNEKTYHRFNNKMPVFFYKTINRIHENYQNDASNIWKGNPKSAAVVRKFIQFEGVSVKIASMAANILVRDFKIPMQDHVNIDISPDRHVRRVFKRTGLIPQEASNEELIYRARELNPEYPGVFDLSCFEIGREYCHQSKPNCIACYLKKYCPMTSVS